jgi:hypothetical protein
MDSKAATKIFEATLSASIGYRERFLREVPFSFLLVRPDGNVGHVSAIPGVTEDQLMEVVQGLARKHGAVYIITVGEAWEARIGPGRNKVLMVAIEGPDLKLLATVRISESGGILGEASIFEGFTGKFPNLVGLPEDYN